MGHIDLSVGSNLAVANALAVAMGGSMAGAIALGLLAGLLVGIVNGFLVTRVGINSFVATLGTMVGLRGFAYVYTGGQGITGNFLEVALALNQRLLGPVSPRFLIMLLLVLAFAFFVGATRWGIDLQAIGGDKVAARAAGVPVDWLTFLGFVLSGGAAGLAGAVQGLSLNAATPQLGDIVLLPVLAAIVIGGTSMLGGKGSIVGSLFGVLTLTTLAVGLNLQGISSSVQQVITGSILLVMIVVDRLETGQARLPKLGRGVRWTRSAGREDKSQTGADQLSARNRPTES
jgi:ribose/xylose/arabinose/galactoside ABC-type transport system permease subunit